MATKIGGAGELGPPSGDAVCSGRIDRRPPLPDACAVLRNRTSHLVFATVQFRSHEIVSGKHGRGVASGTKIYSLNPNGSRRSRRT
jgi:hypothetical protein